MPPEIDFDAERKNPILLDAMMIKLMPDQRMRDLELDLFSSKWFDYRFMHPVDATNHYIEHHRDIYKDKFGQNIDTDIAEGLNLADLPKMIEWLKDPKKSKKIRSRLTGYWRGRQHADALGMPYDVYIDCALDERLRFWQQRYLPQPTQLYGERVIDAVSKRWEEIQNARLFVGTHPTYLTNNYRGTPDQDDHHEWIFKLVYSKEDKYGFLATMIEDSLITYEKVESRLMPDELERLSEFL